MMVWRNKMRKILDDLPLNATKEDIAEALKECIKNEHQIHDIFIIDGNEVMVAGTRQLKPLISGNQFRQKYPELFENKSGDE